MMEPEEVNLSSPTKTGSKIPGLVSNFKRSHSVRVRGEKVNSVSSIPTTPFPSIAEREEIADDRIKYWNKHRLSLNLRSRSQASGLNRNQDDDLESLDSFVSNISGLTTNSTCEHAHFAKNGTTYSGRTHKYIIHCSMNYNTPEEYLTPTQRANKNIRRLKTLLQLAKEKLREKEQEIFKLTKEVVELKVFKASVNHPNFSDDSSPSDEKDVCNEIGEKPVNRDASVQVFGSTVDVKDFGSDAYNDLSPIKASYYFDDKEDDMGKMSPVSPQHCFVEKTSATPDFLLSSLADSGNFDDLASSISVHSKDSLGFTIAPELIPLREEKQDGDSRDREEERARIVNMYENKLKENKSDYEAELKRILDDQEDKNVALMEKFEDRLKQEERKFEIRWNDLLKSSEQEKIMIVERFEEKLEEEKQKYLESLASIKAEGGKMKDAAFGESYVRSAEEEKQIYESALKEMKEKFENEKKSIEENFDLAVKSERKRFEDSVADIKRSSDCRILELLEKITDIEARYNELLPKYEEVVQKNQELEKDNEMLRKTIEDQDERHKAVYLKMYLKGQEAEKLQHANQVAEFAEKAPERVSVPELLAQLKVTETKLENLKDKEYRARHTESHGVCLLSSKEAISLWMLAARKAMYHRLAEAQEKSSTRERTEDDPETTLQFLKSAVYYFLTDRDNHLGHLRAIESILGFTLAEKHDIEKCYVNKL